MLVDYPSGVIMSPTVTTCEVTNSITLPVPDTGSAQTGWDGSILAINAFNSSDSSTGQGYGQDTLQVMPFSTGNTLPAGSAASLDMDATMPGTTTEMTLYDLIFAQPTNLFPAGQASAMDLFGAYAPITIDSASSGSCANAWLFYQNIMAFPSSTVAVQFQQVLNATYSSATSSSSIDSAVNAFFAGTEGYQNVTFDNWVAVSSYLNAFAFAWANFAASYTYYMYQSSGQQSSGGTPAAATAAGAVTLTQSASGPNPASLTDPNGGYSVQYTPSGGSPVALTFSASQFVSATDEDFPLIAVQCSYMQLSQFTGNANDAATLVPVLCGSVNGQQMIGLNYQIPADNPGLLTQIQEGIQDFFNAGGITDFMQITGFVMGLKLLYDGLAYLRQQFNGAEQENDGADPDEDQVEEAQSDTDEAMSESEESQQEVANRLGEGEVEVVSPDDLDSVQSDLTDDQELVDEEEEGEAEEDALGAQADQIEDNAAVSVDSTLETDAETVDSDMASEVSAESSGNISDLDSTNATVGSSIATTSESLDELDAEDASEMSGSEEASVASSEAAETDAEEDEEADEEAAEDEAAGDDDDDLEDDDDLDV